ncbi:SHOCT domain-containing protein [Streptomyces sp. NPDC005476]|uniref:SHOCT domain-containing protein n=1 Tax=Streptomyces sp. NPDC005476 TaxID=3156882 RepID=UPI00345704E3
MMFWYGHDPSGWGWFAMSVGMVLFWAVLIALGVLLFRASSRPAEPGATTGPEQRGPVAEQVLAERFARGEIEEDEYRRRLTVLRSPDSPRSGKR